MTIDLGNKRFVEPNGEVIVKVLPRATGKWKELNPALAYITPKLISVAGYNRFDRATGKDRSAWYSGRHQRRAVAYRIGTGEWQQIAEPADDE